MSCAKYNKIDRRLFEFTTKLFSDVKFSYKDFVVAYYFWVFL